MPFQNLFYDTGLLS